MVDHIKIGDVSPRVQYTADGTQTVFVYPFPIFKDADMEVFLNDAPQTTGYAVAGAGRSEGGTVTFDAPPAKGVLVTLRSNFVIERTSDFQPYGELRAKVLNDELDYLTACVKQVNEEARRSLRLAPTDPADIPVLPKKADRASRVFAFDADGDPTVSNRTLAEIESGAADASASAAQAKTFADNAAAGAGAAETAKTAAQASASDASASAEAAKTAATTATGGGILSGETDPAKARDILDVYAKSEIDGKLDLAVTDDVYTKAEIDRLFTLAYAVITSTTTTGSQGVLFDDFSSDSLAIKTNAMYNADGNYYANDGSLKEVTEERFAFDNGHYSNFVARYAFDANKSGTWWSTSYSGQDGVDAFIGQNFGSKKHIVQISVKQQLPNVSGVEFQYSDDNQNWITALTWFDIPNDSASHTSQRFNVGAHQYWRLSPQGRNVFRFSTGYWSLLDFEMFELFTPKNMTLRSKPQTLAQTTPKNAELYFMVREIDTLDYANDWALLCGLEATGGTVFEAATLHSVQGFGQDKIVRFDVDLTGASGDKFVWELKTANNKAQRIEQVAVMPFY